MYQIVFNDFRQLLAQYDAQISASDNGAPDESGLYQGGFGAGDNVSRKLMKALNVRQQIATSLAEHDAQLALDFFTDSAQAVTNPKFRKQIEQSDSYFETRLLAQITAQNVDAALKYARKILAKGFNYELVGVLKKIYEKDADKGAAFGEDIVQKLKSEDFKNEKLYYLTSVLNLGVENLKEIKKTPAKKPMFSEQTLRDLAEITAQEMLRRNTTAEYNGIETLKLIEQILPARAAQIRQKVTSKATISSSSSASSIAAKAQIERDAQDNLMENIQAPGAKQLSKEEREKAVGQARKAIAEIKDPNQKLFALSGLASQVAALGDKELAAQILDDARNSVNLQPKNYMEFMQVWVLTSSYAQVDAEKAFPILEDAILRLNDTISAFVKVGEFMDVNGEIIEGGEIQVGSFGGAMTRDLLGSLGATDTTIRSLAKTDFARTKDLTNKFDRAEARILAKMIVLRALFANKKVKED